MNSIDRKLARVAREIALAKPARMSFLDFEQVSHDYVLGSAGKPKQQESQPPSVQKFNVGDRFRVKNDFENLFPINEFVAHRVVDGDQVWAIDPSDKMDGFFWAHNIELIEPAPSPASETEGDGWVAWGGGEMPPYACVEVKFEDGMHFKDTSPRSLDLRCWTYQGGPKGNKIIAYRVVKP